MEFSLRDKVIEIDVREQNRFTRCWILRASFGSGFDTGHR